ncbi:MAG: TonB-dependent receptor [Pseudomonadota bacterium]
MSAIGNRLARPNCARFRLSLMATALALPVPALAQEAPAEDESQDENAIIVTGEISRVIESSLETKRSLDVIGDAIVGDNIGDLPSLSIAEALERVVGVTAERFQGGSTGIAVRGLGSFLGASFINGREVTSGADGRDVNFSQFPSELIDGAIVYKTQRANFIEGGIAGNIELQTLRALDYNKRRIQVFAQGGYSDAQDRVNDGRSPVERRFSASYIDQFDTNIGKIGVAIGGQFRRGSFAEDIFTSSSTYRPCNTIEGVDRSNNCTFLTDSDGNSAGASDPYLISNQYIFRAQSTRRDQEALLGSIQWQPSPSLDITLDAQWSDRRDDEERANLVVADGRRDIAPIAISSTGALLAHTGETRIENQQVFRERDEEFIGLGGNIEWNNGGPLTLSADVGYTKTERFQDERDMRIRTSDRLTFEYDARGNSIPSLTFLDVSDIEEDTGLAFDLNNHDLYDNGQRARRRLETVDESVFALRFDASYETGGFFKTVDAGFRYGDRQRIQDDGIDSTVSLASGAYFTPQAIATRRDTFLVDDLFSGSGSPMEGLTFAGFHARDLFTALTGDADAGLPTGSTLSAQDTDVTEETYAGYVQGNFDANMFGLPASGNIGLRVVRTDVTSVGVSSALATSPGPDPDTVVVTEVGDPTINVETNGFWTWLPSANIAFELDDEKLLRFAVYRAIARPDPAELSAALTFDDNAELSELGAIVRASGNPFIEPLQSWNADVSFEWYFGPTSSFQLAGYYKLLQTGFETSVTPLTLQVDGAPTEVLIGRRVNSDDESRLLGFEVALQHKFDTLPAPFDGLGVQAAYNFADTGDFETPDPVVVSGLALADFTEPAGIRGASRHTVNANVFYDSGPFSARVAYRYRSGFFRPFRQGTNRFNAGQDFVDFSAFYNVTKNVQLRLQALNIFDEPNRQFRPVPDSRSQTEISGPLYYVGARLRF